MNIASFKDWQKQKIRRTGAKEKVICPECLGEGLYFSECAKEDKCYLCHGQGLVKFGELDFHLKQRCFPVSDYHREAEKDILALSRWTGKSFVETCIDFGFSVCSRISNKKETCLFPE